jgi:hypothetical protein
MAKLTGYGGKVCSDDEIAKSKNFAAAQVVKGACAFQIHGIQRR